MTEKRHPIYGRAVFYLSMEILREVQRIKENYEKGTVDIIDGLPYSMYQTLRRIEFYTNSRYLNGNTDNRNRVKPFYNITNFRINVAVRATDIDTKDFTVFSDNPKHYVKSMLFSKEMKNWMKRVSFAKTLNDFGYTRAKYGGVLIKRVRRGGELHIQIPEWKNIVTDSIDIINGVKGERHYMTKVQFQSKMDAWNNLADNLDLVEKTMKKTHGKNYSSSDRVCVLEIEGEFENEYVNETNEGYCLQKHFILLDQDDNAVACLHSEKKTTSDYKYLAWFEASGRGLGIGIAEDSFEAQVAINDSILKESDIMEIASRTLFWTDSASVENNLLTDVESGQLLKVLPGEQFQVLNSTPNSLPQLDNIRVKWDEQVSRATSTFEAVTGETMPSGTPFRSLAVQNQEGMGLFSYRMEEAGIFWRGVFADWIVPHLKGKLTRAHVLTSDFTTEELQVIDEAVSTERANRKVIDRALQGKVTNIEDYQVLLESEKELMRVTKGIRFIDIPDDYFKDLEAQIDINITGEQLNKGVMFETINNMLVTITQSFNPNTGTFSVLEDPILSKIFGKAVEMTGIGISPAELIPHKATQPQATQPTEPLIQEPASMTT